MPEIPDLEVIKAFLNERIVGKEVVWAKEVRPAMVRCLAADDFSTDVTGRRFGTVSRQGKMLTLPLEPDRLMVMHMMLTGALQYCTSDVAVLKRTFFILGMSDMDLRYLDQRQMGMVYYVRPDQLSEVPRLEEQGPDAYDGGLSLEEFTAQLKPFNGEIKGILTRGRFVSGIGNAYVDEVLFAAKISPFKRRKGLSAEDIERLYHAIPEVMDEAINTLQERMVPDIHVKVRDFLKVHRKGGEACPRCGHTISELTANRRITSYCRNCQPGMLIKN